MANFKRKKCKRQVRCTLCTPNKWKGNSRKGIRKSTAIQDIKEREERDGE